jgi:hypothetical protein
MGKKENKSEVRNLVESGAVRDMGWDEKEVWRRAKDLVKSWKKEQRGMRVVEVQEEVKKLRKNVNGEGDGCTGIWQGGHEWVGED